MGDRFKFSWMCIKRAARGSSPFANDRQWAFGIPFLQWASGTWPIRRKRGWPHNANIESRIYHAHSYVQFDTLSDEHLIQLNFKFFNGSNEEIDVERTVGNIAIDNMSSPLLSEPQLKRGL